MTTDTFNHKERLEEIIRVGYDVLEAYNEPRQECWNINSNMIFAGNIPITLKQSNELFKVASTEVWTVAPIVIDYILSIVETNQIFDPKHSNSTGVFVRLYDTSYLLDMKNKWIMLEEDFFKEKAKSSIKYKRLYDVIASASILVHYFFKFTVKHLLEVAKKLELKNKCCENKRLRFIVKLLLTYYTEQIISFAINRHIHIIFEKEIQEINDKHKAQTNLVTKLF